ncbi:MAG: hypothetical protein ACE5JQ_07990 [Candidatus Methylomirabilales bacterium]
MSLSGTVLAGEPVGTVRRKPHREILGGIRELRPIDFEEPLSSAEVNSLRPTATLIGAGTNAPATATAHEEVKAAEGGPRRVSLADLQERGSETLSEAVGRLLDVRATSQIFAQEMARMPTASQIFTQEMAKMPTASQTFTQEMARMPTASQIFTQEMARMPTASQTFAQEMARMPTASQIFAQEMAKMPTASQIFAQEMATILSPEVSSGVLALSRVSPVRTTDVSETVTPAAESYARSAHLYMSLELTKKVIRETMPSAIGIYVDLKNDPEESNYPTICFKITIGESVDRVLELDDLLQDRLYRDVPPGHRTFLSFAYRFI